MIEGIKVIGFDADDTLWTNEIYFRETEERVKKLLSPYVDAESIIPELYHTEMQNMHIYGYGIKAFILSVLETAIRITDGKLPVSILQDIILLGKNQLSHPAELLEGVEDTLNALVGRYRLIVVTKGDLLDQEKKLRESGLEHLFHHVEIMSNKNEGTYKKLLQHLDVRPEEFVMIGNSLRSDILPPLALGCYAIHVPYYIVWEHERVDEPVVNSRFYTADSLWDVVSLLP
ncbi:MAG: HAD hydrolase-like protein [Tannerellaceae bacterium]|nr:HAD hydrolase-like protein [Tannerellaceae bacterium]